MPLFSIIVPVYKTEEYLHKCVSSILEQSFGDFELILVDDGSPDQCPELCDNFARQDDRIKVIHKENGGVSSARNAGIAVATGEYIWFVDSDDYILPDALAILENAMEEERADLYAFNGKCRDIFCEGNLGEFLSRYYFNYILGFGPCNKLYRRNCLTDFQLYFDTQETIGEDLLFNILYYKTIFDEKNPVVRFLDHELYYYAIREGSAMTTKAKSRLQQQMRLFDKLKLILENRISQDHLFHFFLLHLISGINQASEGGLTAKEFSAFSFGDYRSFFRISNAILQNFFEMENASLLGRIRVYIFLFLMRTKCYNLAGKIMGLK